MTLNKYRVYTGPTLVDDVAAYLTDYFNTVTAGTEWVYVVTTLTAEDVLRQVNTKFSGFTARDVQTL